MFSFIKNIKHFAPSATCKIHINNRLHGKIYLFHYESKRSQAIISSANLTDSGLNRNHEWGILTDEQALIEQLEKELNETIEYDDILHELISGKMRLFAEQAMGVLSKESDIVDVNADLIKLLKNYAVPKNKDKSLSLQDARQVFLKPIGTKEEPILAKDQKRFGDLSKLDFPNPKPKQIDRKDILISFGTGGRAILCIHTAITGVEEKPKDLQAINKNAERWPWFVNAYNHTSKFADRWWEYNITIDQCCAEYLEQNPNGTITSAGGKTLGSFEFGAGHLAISMDFANFLCNKILSIEADLANI